MHLHDLQAPMSHGKNMVGMPICWDLLVQCGECPGINAFHCEGRGWVLSADEMNKIEFRGQYANIRPTGLVRVDFQDGETYQWNPLVTVIQHIILGKVRPFPQRMQLHW